jgi:hypothetical protein
LPKIKVTVNQYKRKQNMKRMQRLSLSVKLITRRKLLRPRHRLSRRKKRWKLNLAKRSDQLYGNLLKHSPSIRTRSRSTKLSRKRRKSALKSSLANQKRYLLTNKTQM